MIYGAVLPHLPHGSQNSHTRKSKLPFWISHSPTFSLCISVIFQQVLNAHLILFRSNQDQQPGKRRVLEIRQGYLVEKHFSKAAGSVQPQKPGDGTFWGAPVHSTGQEGTLFHQQPSPKKQPAPVRNWEALVLMDMTIILMAKG